jgi:hypothetical protein
MQMQHLLLLAVVDKEYSFAFMVDLLSPRCTVGAFMAWHGMAAHACHF